MAGMAGMADNEADGGGGDQRAAGQEQTALVHARAPWRMRGATGGRAAVFIAGAQKKRMDTLRRADLAGRRRSSIS
jgi:hypothetical protein